jgi:hypothetical protein
MSRGGGSAGDLAADRLAQQITVHAPDEVDWRAFHAANLLHSIQNLALTLWIADGCVRTSFLAAHVGDDAKALSNQLDDLLVKVAEALAELRQRGIRFWHEVAVYGDLAGRPAVP